MRLPFGTINIPERSKKLIAECLESTRISGGRLVRELEERFAAITGVKEAVAVSTGTDADTLALAVLHDRGAKRGDEVIIPALSFVATGNAVLHAGFTPSSSTCAATPSTSTPISSRRPSPRAPGPSCRCT
jgi:CDP-4-dehydro-6-deoxyglucose reductase, E1